MLEDQINSLYKDMHPNYAWTAKGKIPSTEAFTSQISKINYNIEYKYRNNILLNGNQLDTYMEGYVEGVLEALSTMEWNTHLIYKFVATYLKVKYLEKYPMYDYESWYNTLSRELMNYYDEEFVKNFMEKYFEDGSLPLVN